MRERPTRSRLLPMVALAALAILSACGEGEKTHRGIELMPDMFHTPAYKRQVAMVVPATDSSDNKAHHWPSLMAPVPGTVSRAGPTYPFAATDFASARQLVNPLMPTSEILKQGQYGFNIYCVVCHGRDGNAANGYVAKHFAGIPSVNGPNIAALSDGEIYHIITCGRGRMPNYAAQLLPENRWAVVHYVRALSRASLALMDVEKMVQDAELSLHDHPNDGKAKTDLEQNRNLLDQRRHDLAEVQRVGSDAGSTFIPLPDPRPEYAVPVWPEASPHASQESGK